MTELQILSAVKNHNGSMEYTELLNLDLTDPIRDPLADKTRIEQMIKNELLEGDAQPYHIISISDKGRLHLQNSCYLEEQNNKLAQETAKDKAEQQRQNRFLRITTLISLGIAAISASFALIGLFIK